MRQVLVAAASLLVGLVLGMFIERATAPAPAAPAPADVAPPPAPDLRRPAKAPHPPPPVDSPVPAAVPAAPAATPPARHDTPAARAPGDGVMIPRSLFRSLSISPFKAPGTGVSDEMAALLQITADERARLDDLAKRTKAAVEEAKFARAAVNEQSEGRVVLTIKADPEAAERQQVAYRAGVMDVLGQERASLFMERVQPYAQNTFDNFGANNNTLTITRDEASGMLRVESKQTYKHNDGASGSMASTYMSKEIPEPWRKYFQTPE